MLAAFALDERRAAGPQVPAFRVLACRGAAFLVAAFLVPAFLELGDQEEIAALLLGLVGLPAVR